MEHDEELVEILLRGDKNADRSETVRCCLCVSFFRHCCDKSGDPLDGADRHEELILSRRRSETRDQASEYQSDELSLLVSLVIVDEDLFFLDWIEQLTIWDEFA